MRKLGSKVKKEIETNPYYRKCARYEIFHDHECQGRITMEHCWVYAGHQIDEIWAIIPICAWSHDVDEFQGGGHLDKEKNEYISIMRMTSEDEAKYDRFNWQQRKKYLTGKFARK